MHRPHTQPSSRGGADDSAESVLPPFWRAPEAGGLSAGRSLNPTDRNQPRRGRPLRPRHCVSKALPEEARCYQRDPALCSDQHWALRAGCHLPAWQAAPGWCSTAALMQQEVEVPSLLLLSRADLPQCDWRWKTTKTCVQLCAPMHACGYVGETEAHVAAPSLPTLPVTGQQTWCCSCSTSKSSPSSSSITFNVHGAI